MKIKNIGDLSAQDLQQVVSKGGKFIYFPYALSFGIVTLQRTSSVYLIHSGETITARRFRFTLVSFVFGWWGLYGPKHTIKAIRTNLRGGKDVTNEVMAVINGYDMFEESQQKKGRTKLSKINL